jgi:Uma2 family endonuclease
LPLLQLAATCLCSSVAGLIDPGELEAQAVSAANRWDRPRSNQEHDTGGDWARCGVYPPSLADGSARRENVAMHRGILNPEKAAMSPATSTSAEIKTLADLRQRLGGIPLERIWFHPAPGTATEKDVIEAEDRENRLCELVDGTLVEKAMGFEESRLAIELAYVIKSYLDQHDLGICVGADGMMRIAPGLVRIPDVSFVTWDRLPGRESPRDAIPDLAPDLAVEVLSEGNTEAEMARKVREYFEAGVVLVWLIDPKKRTAQVFSTREKAVLVRAGQALDGGDVLPGFTLLLSDLLDRGRRPRQG